MWWRSHVALNCHTSCNEHLNHFGGKSILMMIKFLNSNSKIILKFMIKFLAIINIDYLIIWDFIHPMACKTIMNDSEFHCDQLITWLECSNRWRPVMRAWANDNTRCGVEPCDVRLKHTTEIQHVPIQHVLVQQERGRISVLKNCQWTLWS